MSTAKFDTLSNLAGTQSVPVATVAQGSAKAWVNFNGTGTVAIRASFNVSSISDNGVGDYTVNLTTAMPDINWSSQCDTNDEALGLHSIYRLTNNQGRTKTTTQCHVCGKDYRHSVSDRNNPRDVIEAMVTIFR